MVSLGGRIMKDPYPSASKYFSELHSMLIESQIIIPIRKKKSLPFLFLAFPIHSSSRSWASLLIPLTLVKRPCMSLCWGQLGRLVLSFQRFFSVSESPVHTPVPLFTLYKESKRIFILSKEGSLLSRCSRQQYNKHILG